MTTTKPEGKTLHDAYGCEIQAGGSDQRGNITAGIDLVVPHRIGGTISIRIMKPEA